MPQMATAANRRCFLDMSIGGLLEGRIVVELNAAVAPRTAENFRALCTGEKGIGPNTGVPLHYKGVRFHRLIKGSMIEGGDISAGDGTGGESIYGLKFDDENFELKHERKGILSMANSGPNTNGSQFFITTTRTSNLDGKHVVFGKVVKGIGVFRAIEHISAGDDDCPNIEIVIADCGEIPEGSDDGISNFFKDGDMYPDWPADLDDKSSEISWWMIAVESAKAFGNDYFKKQDLKMALRKYRKALRYLDVCWAKEDIDEGKASNHSCFSFDSEREKTLQLTKTKSVILTNSSSPCFSNLLPLNLPTPRQNSRKPPIFTPKPLSALFPLVHVRPSSNRTSTSREDRSRLQPFSKLPPVKIQTSVLAPFANHPPMTPLLSWILTATFQAIAKSFLRSIAVSYASLSREDLPFPLASR
ncbi:hypothetical protein M5K25_017848 [Dendrobium thyrsiflorum]|uniref:peptidylprolyl isomerase n=1 Tax=Dendrobium thyrsiflorum TaxID=117978 RepID=A0ABD0UH46_DENTH